MSVLEGYSIIELAGIGPAPMAGMMLADMGATVIRVERPGVADPRVTEPISGRGKKSICIDLKTPLGLGTLLRLIDQTDALIDPFRPGVCEKLGLDPDSCLARNPKLVFARMTGWGQTGPLATSAGHDLNYIAITGALHALGKKNQKPIVPLNLIGDFGGGAMLLVNGILGALLSAQRSNLGQVVDVAMVDGVTQLMWMMQGLQQQGIWNADERESNMLDGGAHFYDTYECKDGKYVAIGSLEPQFYALLIEKTGIDSVTFSQQHEKTLWPNLKSVLAERFKSKTRDEWCEIMVGTDVCFAPVLDMVEARSYDANTARNVFTEIGNMTHPSPAPRFMRTPSYISHGTHAAGADTEDILTNAGFKSSEITELLNQGVILQAK